MAHKNRRRYSSAKIFLFFNLTIIGLVFLLGFRPNAFRPEFSVADLANFNEQTVKFRAWVCAEADLNYKARRLTVCALEILNKIGEQTISSPISGRVLISAKLYTAYDYGDFLEVSGRLQAPPEIEDFDYDRYLARYDIYSVMYYAKLSPLAGNLSGRQKAYRRLLKFKQGLAERLNANLPEPEAGLARAMLLGYRRQILPEDLDLFSRVGLSHMIAISGLHITILSAMVINLWLALGLARRRALFLVLVFLFSYPLLTGLSASAIRAAIMGGLAFLAAYYGRAASSVNALVFAAAVMLVFNPRLLRADIGFQLSFLAILGIIYIYPLGETWSRRFLERQKLKSGWRKFFQALLDIFSLTMTSQIITLPILLINFRQFSLIAPLANLLVIWALPPLLAVLVGGLALTAFIPAAGILWFFPAYCLLKFIFMSAELLAAPPWAAIAVENFNWFWGVVYYFILIIVVRKLKRRMRRGSGILISMAEKNKIKLKN
ncbi:MAG: ComEC/Rec2 family competence protein [Patescibacteria group bacterium]